MDDKEHPAFGFGLDYGNELIYCETVMHDNYYELLFNGAWVGTVAHTDDFEWIQASGAILPQSTVDEIGLRIMSQYN